MCFFTCVKKSITKSKKSHFDPGHQQSNQVQTKLINRGKIANTMMIFLSVQSETQSLSSSKLMHLLMSEVSKGTSQVLADEQLTLYGYLLCAIYWRLISCYKIQTPKCTLLWHDKASLSTCLDLRPYFDSHEKQ